MKKKELLQKLIMVKFLRNLNISIDDVKAILNNELDFKECLEINQIHLEKQIKNLEEVKENIEMYVSKDLPMLPALKQQIRYLLEENLQRNLP